MQFDTPKTVGRAVRYYFGRLNVFFPSEDKYGFVKKALSADLTYEKRGYNWGFFDIQELESHLGLFFTGYLAKYKTEKEEEVADIDKHKIEDQTLENLIEAKARFFVHIDSGIIGFHPISNKIEIDQFCVVFAEIVEEAYAGFFVQAEIQLIEERVRIFEEIKKFNIIKHLGISLIPTNPTNIPEYREIDERLKRLRTSRYKESYDTDDDERPLRIEEDEDINSKLKMAIDGYGKGEISGIKEGEVAKVKTGDNPVSTFAPSDDAPLENIFGTIKSAVEKILGRFKNEG